MATEALASWAAGLQYETLPAPVVEAAARSFYNWAGCAIGGSDHPAAAIARHSLQPFSGPPTSTILGTAHRTDAQSAALLNGISSHVHDYDDTHLDTIIHPTGPVASALLAVAEWKKPVSGRDFVLALVAGIEAECKVGLAVWPKHYDIGWHITSTAGSIGAAVAVSKLLGLDVEATQNAIGIAATQVTGLRDQFGSMTKSFHPGRAAQNGLLAAVLASNGYDSSHVTLEAKRGWANVVSTSNDLEKQIESLGKTWEIEKNSFKPFPCGIVIHPVIDACIKLQQSVKRNDLHPTKDTQGILTVHPLVLELTGKKTPQTGLEGKFSVYHSAAVAFLRGKATPAEYEDAVVNDEAVKHLRDQLTARVDENLRPDEAHVWLNLGHSVEISEHVDHAVGSLEVPLSDVQLEEKFLDQSSKVLGAEAAKKASDACWQLVDVADVTEITAAMMV